MRRRGELHVGPEAARLDAHLEAGDRVDTELAAPGRRREDLERQLDGQLVGGEVAGDRGGLLAALQVRAVAAGAGLDQHALGVGADGDRVDGGGVDAVEVGDQLLQSSVPLVPEVEEPEEVDPASLAAGHLVEVVLHLGGEGEVDQLGEVLLQQRHHREADPVRHQRLPLLPDVAGGERPHDRGVGGGAADAELLQLLHQRGLGVAGRWRGDVADRLERGDLDGLALAQLRQRRLLVVERRLRIVGPLDVGAQVAGEEDGAPAGAELAALAAGGGGLELDRDRLALGVGHLGGDGPLPDEIVEPQLGAAQLAGERVGSAEGVAGRADGLVGLLGVLGLLGVGARRGRQELVAVELGNLGAGGGERGGRERGAVGAHVGDVAALVEPLGQAHHLLGREAQLAAALLLHGGGDEGGLGRAAVALLLQRADREGAPIEAGGEGAGGRLVEEPGVGGEEAQLVEVLAGGDAAAGDLGERRGEGRGGRVPGGDVPVGAGAEAHALQLALDDQLDGGRLDAAGRELGADLAPEHR